MAIKINRDGIQFRNFSITNSVDGIYIDGTFTANGQFVDATQAQGSVSGYTSGGYNPTPSDNALDTIDKFSFASDSNATDVGNLASITDFATGQSSLTNGYVSGGFANSAPTPSPIISVTNIQKYPFATDTNASDVANLTQARRSVMGQSSISSGYSSGGIYSPGGSQLNTIDKFPFSSDSDASDVGDLSVSRYGGSGTSSTTHGYVSGGDQGPGPFSNVIDKFPFAIDNNATDVGDITQTRRDLPSNGMNSSTHGYTAGGTNDPPNYNTVDKFPFSSDNNAGDVGNLTDNVKSGAGQSSGSNGYVSGGRNESGTILNTVNKFPFAIDIDASDVLDLFQSRSAGAGQQV